MDYEVVWAGERRHMLGLPGHPEREPPRSAVVIVERALYRKGRLVRESLLRALARRPGETKPCRTLRDISNILGAADKEHATLSHALADLCARGLVARRLEHLRTGTRNQVYVYWRTDAAVEVEAAT